MKKRRSTIISLLLVAALCLGIGYAALTDELTINGNVKSDGATMNNTFDELVYFTNAVVTNEPATHITANVSATYGGDTASYSIEGLKAVGDIVVMEFTIHNAYSETVWVSLKDHEAFSNDFISITNDYTGALEIAPNTNATFEITVEVVELTSEGIDLSHDVLFDVSDANPNG